MMTFAIYSTVKCYTLLNIGWGEGGYVFCDFTSQLWLFSNVTFGGFIAEQLPPTFLMGGWGLHIGFFLSACLVPFILHMIVWNFNKLSHYWVKILDHFIHVSFNYMSLLAWFINCISAAIFPLLISLFFYCKHFHNGGFLFEEIGAQVT